jgi:hypothetical protein
MGESPIRSWHVSTPDSDAFMPHARMPHARPSPAASYRTVHQQCWVMLGPGPDEGVEEVGGMSTAMKRLPPKEFTTRQALRHAG